jgi:hypothetical protein
MRIVHDAKHVSHCDQHIHDVWIGVLPQEMAISSESYENFVNNMTNEYSDEITYALTRGSW